MKIYKFENGAIKGDLDGAGIKDAEKKYGRLLTVTEGHRIVPVFYGARDSLIVCDEFVTASESEGV